MIDRRLLAIDTAGAAALLTLAAALHTFALRPLRDARAAVVEREALAAARLGHAERLGASLRTLDHQVEEARRAMNASPLRLRPADRVNQRVSALTTLALAQRLRIDEITPGSPLHGPRFTRVPIRLAGAGAYTDFVRFLHLVAADAGDLAVVAFDAGCGGPCSPLSPATFSLDLTWFAAPAGSAGGADRTAGAADDDR